MTRAMEDEPRAKTADEMRDEFMDAVRCAVAYWAKESRQPDCVDKLSGLAHSLLCLIDGVTAGFPALDLVCSPHPDDEEFYKSEGEDWVPAGAVINESAMLHEMLYTDHFKNWLEHLKKYHRSSQS